MKKIIFLFVLSLVSFGVFITPAFASGDDGMPSVEEQIKDFEQFEENLTNGNLQIYLDKEGDSSSLSGENKIVPQGTTGRYPTRKGTILVTDGLRVDSLVGHAGVVLSSTQTIESFPKGGVQYKTDKWTNRYKRVWGITTYGTTISQDAAAGSWANSQKGKPYNYNFFNISTTTKFYCSQLVYKAVLTKTGVNLNWLGGVVTPSDLVNSGNSYSIYTYKK